MIKNRFLFLLPLFLLGFNSCAGISADIQIRKDGSGKIVLEYRFSRMAEAIGKLDGNEKWHIIPAGRADMERTVARIDGMKLVSFSTKENKNDIINKVKLEFSNTQALVKFLDPSGKRAYFSREGSSNKLAIIFNESVPAETDPQLLDLVRSVSEPYRCGVSFSAWKNSEMSVTNGAGGIISAPKEARVVTTGKKVSFSAGTADLLEKKDGLGLIFTW
ncbi:MAG: hypothetical protein LBH16_07150 [Treponema sp.]|jgi:hypothetical protein|nr:hypothetical protein [Treponema sp.]